MTLTFSSIPCTLLLAAGVVALSLVSTSSAHGVMCSPRQRGAYHAGRCIHNTAVPKDPVQDWCPHCLNGGRVETVIKNLNGKKWRPYEPTKKFDAVTYRAGVCGDPKGGNDHMLGGKLMPYKDIPFVAHYKTGGMVDFSAELSTNHMGYFEFFLCDISSCSTNDLSPACFKEGKCHKLERVPHPDCQNPSKKTKFECAPIDKAYPSRWYLPCTDVSKDERHIVGGESGTMRYQLPAGVSCKHCVVQWYWATINSCAPWGFHEYMKKYDYPYGLTCKDPPTSGPLTFNPDKKLCGKEDNAVPEEYWSCADVQVTRDGKSAGPVRALSAGSKKMPSSGSDYDEKDSDSSKSDKDDKKIPNMNSEEPKKKRNFKSVQRMVSRQLAVDLKKEASMTRMDMRRERRRAKRGVCVADGGLCDGKKMCCGHGSVCAYVSKQRKFVCRSWWLLYMESKQRK